MDDAALFAWSWDAEILAFDIPASVGDFFYIGDCTANFLEVARTAAPRAAVAGKRPAAQKQAQRFDQDKQTQQASHRIPSRHYDQDRAYGDLSATTEASVACNRIRTGPHAVRACRHTRYSFSGFA
jgi:hypothetical protein